MDNDLTKFFQERYLQNTVNLDSKTHLELVCDFETIKQTLECIEYVSDNQTYENERSFSGEPNSYNKFKYAKYFIAFKTCKFLADYAVSLINDLEQKFSDGLRSDSTPYPNE